MEIGREMNFSGEILLEKIYKAKKEEKLRGSFHKQRWDLESSIVQESPNQERKKKSQHWQDTIIKTKKYINN